MLYANTVYNDTVIARLGKGKKKKAKKTQQQQQQTTYLTYLCDRF